jgi:hypothetical protein
MKHITRSILLLFVFAGLLLSACGAQIPVTGEEEEIKAAEVESIEGSDLHRVTLTEEGARRIDLQMSTVSEEQITRKRTVGGTIVLPLEASDTYTNSASIKVWIHVPLSGSELSEIDRDQPALILPIGELDSANALAAHVVDEGNGGLYFALDATQHNLTLGQHVQTEVSLLSGGKRQVVPYNAVIYGVNGETWVFVNPEPLTFVRVPIVIDFIEGDHVVLLEGPEVGTPVVTLGAEELYGSEFEFAEE